MLDHVEELNVRLCDGSRRCFVLIASVGHASFNKYTYKSAWPGWNPSGPKRPDADIKRKKTMNSELELNQFVYVKLYV